MLYWVSQVSEGSHDGGSDPGAADGDAGDDGPPLVEVLGDAVQPGQVDDAQPQAHQTAGGEVEEEDAGGQGGEEEARRGQDSAHHRGQAPAQLVGHVGGHWAWGERQVLSKNKHCEGFCELLRF